MWSTRVTEETELVIPVEINLVKLGDHSAIVEIHDENGSEMFMRFGELSAIVDDPSRPSTLDLPCTVKVTYTVLNVEQRELYTYPILKWLEPEKVNHSEDV